MTGPGAKPVIFLAFANDRDDQVGYLRNLPEEARRLRAALERAQRDGLCNLVERSNATLDDILDVFQDPQYRNRIAVFHYGGHANGYYLLLESAEGTPTVAHAGGLAAFLGQQRGLQLVFLNACSTRRQVQGLLDAQVPAVIATSRAIEDRVAMNFARRFYQSLAGGASIRTAYREAEAAIRTAHGDDTRGLYWSEAPSDAPWPWALYLRDGAEAAAQWNLPEAAGDPLFGLPTPPPRDLPAIPFRHLNWFDREHAEVFFGRGHEIRDLYQRITAPHSAPIILFYGQSGVGKSSLLAAGLLPRLEGDYQTRYLRRDRAKGLAETLRDALSLPGEDISARETWIARERQIGKPMIVILDQVEEAYTRPTAAQPR